MAVRKIGIIGTNLVIFSVWEITTINGPYGTCMFQDGICFGRIGSKTSGNDLPAGSKERSDAVLAFYEQEYQRAYSLIEKEYSGITGKRSMGEIEVEEKQEQIN